MKKIVFDNHIITIRDTNTGSNYNRFASITRKGDKTPLIGRVFKSTDTKEFIAHDLLSNLVRNEKNI